MRRGGGRRRRRGGLGSWRDGRAGSGSAPLGRRPRVRAIPKPPWPALSGRSVQPAIPAPLSAAADAAGSAHEADGAESAGSAAPAGPYRPDAGRPGGVAGLSAPLWHEPHAPRAAGIEAERRRPGRPGAGSDACLSAVHAASRSACSAGCAPADWRSAGQAGRPAAPVEPRGDLCAEVRAGQGCRARAPVHL